MKPFLYLLLLLVFSACSPSSPSSPSSSSSSPNLTFTDVSTQANILHQGPSFGAGSWGDANGDGLPDLWMGNHANQPNLYINNGDGTFTDKITQYWAGVPTADTHGAVWTDLNKDGTLDLVELVGAQSGAGAGSNHVFMNQAGSFINQAQAKGLDYPLGRGRTPLPEDFNHDGNTDFVFSGFYRAGAATELFMQDPYGHFSPQATAQGMALPNQTQKSAQLADLNNDGILDLVINGYNFPHRIFDVKTLPMVAVTKSFNIPVVSGVLDTTFADFNNDLYTDIYVASYPERKLSQVVQISPTELRFRITNKKLQTKSLSFKSLGLPLFKLGDVLVANVFIGATGWSPTLLDFTLDFQKIRNQGVSTFSAPGVYIGFNTVTQAWEVTSYQMSVNGVVTDSATLSLLSSVGLANPVVTPGKLFMNQGGNQFVDTAIPATFGRSSVAGDFDNDMDVDLYIVESGVAQNKPNVLLLNDGNGNFSVAPYAAGAEGSLQGIGDSVSVVDYDQDGYLDLFVSNGEGKKIFTALGPQQLFHNQGTGNHWLEIDLHGTTSQAEGVGAIVYVTAGGITQKREQNAGIHKNTQNHARLHFGLAQNTIIDTLKVVWPSGKVTLMNNVGIDQIISIQE